MATSARIGSLTLVRRGNGASPEVFTTIPEVQTIPNFGERKDQVEVTHLESTAKEYIGGLADGSELSLAVNYIPNNTQHDGLLADFAADTARNFKVVFVGGETFNLTARVLGYEISGGPNDVVTMTFTLKITGSVTHS